MPFIFSPIATVNKLLGVIQIVGHEQFCVSRGMFRDVNTFNTVFDNNASRKTTRHAQK